jgi:pantoate--beta-alanine ligase
MTGEQPPLLETIEEVRGSLAAVRARGGTIGLVPTMGALHAGHGALIERARRRDDCVVVSIFVNPIQFDRRQDYEAYAIDMGQDRRYCAELGVDLVFAPPAAELYPRPQRAFVEVAGVSEHLCGKFRPGHFRGVATVVMKLFHIIEPRRAYFGEKDGQQLAVIRAMTRDLNMDIEIVPVSTVREPDGLALSSRNRRLSPAEREIAPVLFRALQRGRDTVLDGESSSSEVIRAAAEVLRHCPGARVEYIEVVDADTMQPAGRITGRVMIGAAIWLGATRLIDNLVCEPPAAERTS